MTLQDEEVMNCLSKKDNETYICQECGEKESHMPGKVQK